MSAAPAPAGASAGVDPGRHPSGVVPILQNVVATVNLGTKLDLKQVALHARNAEYNPKRFAAVIMRIREPKTTALIFASGKMVVTGAKSEDDARTAARKYAKIVQKLGFPAQFKEFKIQNMVGSCDVKFPIRLEGLAYQQSLFSSYEPELFPGLIYRMKSPKIVLLIFVSGKVVLTGGKKRDDIYEAFENIYPVLCGFRKGDATVAGMALPRLPGAPSTAGPAAAAAAVVGPSTSMGPPPPVNLANAAAGPSDAGQHEMHLPPPTPLHHSLPPPTPAHAPVASMMGPPYLPPPTPMR